MKALDTNVLVRFLVNDDKTQAELALKLISAAEAKRDVLFVSELVLLELIWVLESVYVVNRTELLDSIDDLLQMPALNIGSLTAVQAFLHNARINKLDLSDLLIGHCARQSGCESVLTFDKGAAKSDLFQQVI
ncbi:hypothetical protein MNBD_GAMMA26-2237 [hydrothermal vent metagenome]|uniref:PIN domain-containing protein n=1 Tax=hydrothermal vent metagenome TaxID=652676 RepID=A0A3B1BRQ2_9ZZZZ